MNRQTPAKNQDQKTQKLCAVFIKKSINTSQVFDISNIFLVNFEIIEHVDLYCMIKPI